MFFQVFPDFLKFFPQTGPTKSKRLCVGKTNFSFVLKIISTHVTMHILNFSISSSCIVTLTQLALSYWSEELQESRICYKMGKDKKKKNLVDCYNKGSAIRYKFSPQTS